MLQFNGSLTKKKTEQKILWGSLNPTPRATRRKSEPRMSESNNTYSASTVLVWLKSNLFFAAWRYFKTIVELCLTLWAYVGKIDCIVFLCFCVYLTFWHISKLCLNCVPLFVSICCWQNQCTNLGWPLNLPTSQYQCGGISLWIKSFYWNRHIYI